ncbi:hypothetical protein KI387_008323, partial [Taxus chinensis]
SFRIYPREPISYRHEEIDRDMPSPDMVDSMEEAPTPWDEDHDVGVGNRVFLVDDCYLVARVAIERGDEEEEKEMDIEVDIALGGGGGDDDQGDTTAEMAAT